MLNTLRSPATLKTQIDENWEYYHGTDLFQFWIGPTVPQSQSDKLALLQRVFQSANILAECVDNWRDGLIGEPFQWQLKDSSGNRVDASEAETQLQRWLDWTSQQAIATGSEHSDPWSEFVLGIGVAGEGNLRLWRPDRFLSDPDPIHHIHLHAPVAGSVEILRGDDGFIDRVSYTYGTNRKEVQEFDAEGLLQITDDDRVLRVETGNRWMIQQVKSPSLLTSSVKRIQNSINHGLSMKLRNQELSGFRERVFTNAQPPGRWEEDADGNEVFIPGVNQRGPGIDQYVSGLPSGVDGDGHASPGIHESQPIPVANLRESIELDIRLLYRQFRQSYRLQAAEGTLSGESRIQQRQEFELFLRGWKRKIESAIANILNIVLRLLGYTNLEAVVELTISTGKLTAEERGIIIAEQQAGLLSKATAIAKLGTVSDVDAELALISEEIREATQPQPRQAADFADDTLPGGNSSGDQNTENNNGSQPPNPVAA